MLIVGGTSLVVYPAAGLIDYYRGSKLVLINKGATSRDSQADLVISRPDWGGAWRRDRCEDMRGTDRE